MRWAALTTKTKATVVVVVAGLLWIGGVGTAGAVVGAVATAAGPSQSHQVAAVDATHAPSPTPTPTPTPTPVVTVSEATTVSPVPFERTTVDDPALPKGQTQLRTTGVDGELTATWRITTTDGVETARDEVDKAVTTPPVAEVTAIGSYVAPVPAPAPVEQAAPAQQAPAAPAPAAITPGAFCADAQSGSVAQAANGRSYQCGGKGPDANGHLHWNTM
ncbi:G5 domain-containing protein [Curtobacterium sp. VKM Ac-2922]|uniref:G5 domain-containing protein n=1 Tax=Curtobacterium sp. VKM Ac-2922 TaxID=2929475 RepID=UPI001FB52004|nr:G5 domain-containing protein [Curtobacterium sp. VKM Ac-2922]MCJ1715377.1 G5 domain-containing protein [Curtobacterium sp. VKM Ac-2922]